MALRAVNLSPSLGSSIIAELRAVAIGGGAANDKAARRLALRATSRISDPVLGDSLHERLLAELEFQIVIRELGGRACDTAPDVLRVADEIEAASRLA